MESWRVELVRGNAGELHAPESTVTESVIKCWRAEFLKVALQNCVHGWFALEPAFSYL